jgi:membrane protein implicated in regulation of membrane protease activity
MTTSVQTNKPSITKEELRAGLKQLLPFSVNKIGETIADLLITLLFTGIAIAVPATLQTQNIPLTYGECTVYIVSIFLLIIVRRVVQDFDDQFTIDELADQVVTLKHI